jgi:hypothetical protein
LKITLSNLTLPASKFVFKNQNQENKILTNVNTESTTFKNGGFFHLARILDGGKES